VQKYFFYFLVKVTHYKVKKYLEKVTKVKVKVQHKIATRYK